MMTDSFCFAKEDFVIIFYFSFSLSSSETQTKIQRHVSSRSHYPFYKREIQSLGEELYLTAQLSVSLSRGRLHFFFYVRIRQTIFATSGLKHIPQCLDAVLVMIGLLLSTSPKQSFLKAHFVLEYTRLLGENH